MKTDPDRKYPVQYNENDPFKLGGKPIPPQPKGSMAQIEPRSALAQAKRAAIAKAMPIDPGQPSLELGQSQGPDEGTPAPEPKGTFTYQAEGDPYKYQLNPDASIQLTDGTGQSMTLKEGPAFQAIMGQIANGQLKPTEPVDPLKMTADQAGQQLNAKLRG